MNVDDFEALARKAGLAKYGLGWTAWESQLERFAKLVEEHTLKALAQPEQEPEPAAFLWQHGETGRTRVIEKDQVWTASDQWIYVGPLYAHPPQRK